MPPPKIIRVSSAEVRAAFAEWLAVEFLAGAKFVILEGLTSSGKTTLTSQPFYLSDRPSKNIEMDDFLPTSVPDETDYLDAVDRSSILDQVEEALREISMLILQGAIVWPAVEPLATKLGSSRVRRVYLKKMAHLVPDFWVDEGWILDPELWPPTGFHRSIYNYHAQQRPWLTCDLIIERIEEASNV